MVTDDLRELDAEIAVKVFGWGWQRTKASGLCGLFPPEGDWVRVMWSADSFEPVSGVPPLDERFTDWDRLGVLHKGARVLLHGVPRYSTEIAAAWDVVERVGCGVRPHGFKEGSTSRNRTADGWEAFVLSWGQMCHMVVAPTAPLAICRAALKAVEAQPVSEVS